MAAAGRAIDLGALREDRDVVAGVPLARRDEADAAVLVVVVVPTDEARDPATGVLDEGERLVGIARSIFGKRCANRTWCGAWGSRTLAG